MLLSDDEELTGAWQSLGEGRGTQRDWQSLGEG